MTEVLASLFASGRIIDLVLVIMALETGLLLWLHRRKQGGVSPRALLPFMAAGACLMLALRAALTGAGWLGVAVPLAAAFCFQLLDIALRWRR